MFQPTARVGPRAIIARRWRALGRARWAVITVALLIGIAGWVSLGGWWNSWPARLVIAAPGGHFPLAFSPDGATLATRGIEPERILLWDATSGRERDAWTIPLRPLRFSGEFSPDGQTFASPWIDRASGKDFSIDLVDLVHGRHRTTCDSPLGGYLDLRFRHGGRSLRLAATAATAANPGVEVVDFDATDGRTLSSRRLGYGRNAWRGAFSPDGNILALTSANSAIRPALVLWDVNLDRALPPIPEPAGSAIVSAIAFSSDGEALAVGRDDGSIEVWDLPTRRLRTTLKDRSPDYPPVAIGFAPDGRTLASTGRFWRRRFTVDTLTFYWQAHTRPANRVELNELIVMDATTGRRLRTSRADRLAVFSPDGRTLATGHDDEAVRLRDAPRP